MKKNSKLALWYRKNIFYDQKFTWDKLALSYMKNGNSILDIGCGEGRFISHDQKRIIGVDHNKKSLEICKNKGYNVKYAKVTELPFKDASFDAVHCSHVIEHLFPKEAHKLLSEMERVLKSGGILCLRTPLLYWGFYHDFTHIKPYYPEAVLHYLRTENNEQRTLEEISGTYKKIKLKYRRGQIFPKLSKIKLLGGFFNLLYKFGISGFKKTGYMLIIKKIK